jgi:hypothetical protein
LSDALAVSADRQEGAEHGRPKFVITQVGDKEHLRPERRQVTTSVGH